MKCAQALEPPIVTERRAFNIRPGSSTNRAVPEVLSSRKGIAVTGHVPLLHISGRLAALERTAFARNVSQRGKTRADREWPTERIRRNVRDIRSRGDSSGLWKAARADPPVIGIGRTYLRGETRDSC